MHPYHAIRSSSRHAVLGADLFQMESRGLTEAHPTPIISNVMPPELTQPAPFYRPDNPVPTRPSWFQRNKKALLWTGAGVGFMVLGIIGALLLLIGVHLYQDHTNLHGLVNMVVQQQQRAAQQGQPTQPAKPTPPQ